MLHIFFNKKNKKIMKKILFSTAFLVLANMLGHAQLVNLKIIPNAMINPTSLYVSLTPNAIVQPEMTNIIFTIKTSPFCGGNMGTHLSLGGITFNRTGPFALSGSNYYSYSFSGSWTTFVNSAENLVVSIPISGGGSCSYEVVVVDPTGNSGDYYVEGGANLTGAIDNQALAVVLPVELLSFKANRNGEKTAIKWESVQEVGIANYVVQRSTDGVNFQPMGTVKPTAKNAQEKAAYTFMDEKPTTGINYYRLQMNDVDGRVAYSKIESVDFAAKLSGKTFPNPFSANLTVEVELEKNIKGDVSIEVFDMVGKLIYSKKVVADGSKLNVNIPTEDLVSGAYLLRMKNGNDTWQQKITKH
jgi:hypothetical protein